MTAKQTEFEKEHGKVSRVELRKNILGMFDDLDDYQFHNLYAILWDITAGKLLYKLADGDRKRLQKELAKKKGVQ